MQRKTIEKKGNNLLIVFAAVFGLFFLALGSWSLATPPMASPDESVQVAKAAAVARGELIGQTVGGSLSPKAVVKIPAAYADLSPSTGCYVSVPSIPSACNLKDTNSNKIVSYTIYNARYQPLYYALVGLPTLFIRSTSGIYFMRLVSSAMSALFLALAVIATIRWSRSRFLLAGIIVAATPSVLFFGGVVNPVGFEASVAICFWTCLLILVCGQKSLGSVPKGLIGLIAVSGGIECMVRSLSPFWVGLTLLIAIIVANRNTLTELLHNKTVRLGAALAGVGGIAGVAWIVAFRATNVLAIGYQVSKSASNWNILMAAISRSRLYYKEIISYFGMLNVPSPRLVYFGWGLLIGALCVAALYYGNWRQNFGLLTLGLLVIAVPIAIASTHARRLGIVWQGGDSLPLFVGIPILATAIIDNSRAFSARSLRRTGLPIIVLAAGCLTIVAFVAELERYAVGTPILGLSIFNSLWHPPLTIIGLCLGEISLITLLVIAIIRIDRSSKLGTNHYVEDELQGKLPRPATASWSIN